MKTIKVYFGCALTHAPGSFQKGIEQFKDRLRKIEGVEVLDFIGLVGGTSTDVYKHDIHTCVQNGELIIGECSYPSIGLGWELGTAVEKHKKHVLAVAHTTSVVTRLVLGAECELNENFSFARYDDFEQLYEICLIKIQILQNAA